MIVAFIITVFIFIYWKKGRDKHINIGIMGDSIAKRTGRNNNSFAPNIEKNSNYRVKINTGVGGATSQDIMLQIPDIIKSGVKIVVVTGGINDILQGVPLKKTIKNMLITDIQLKGAGIKVARLNIHRCKWNENVTPYNKLIKGINLNTKISDLVDKFHFSEKGRKVAALSIIKALIDGKAK